MGISVNTFIRDFLLFIKTDLASNVTDPLGSRLGNSSFVMTSYPQRQVEYPLITLKVPNMRAVSAGMQTSAMDIECTMEIRVWARNEAEKDSLFTSIFNRLRSIQYTASTGSIAQGLNDYELVSSVEVDEEGEQGIKSRIAQIKYRFYNVS